MDLRLALISGDAPLLVCGVYVWTSCDAEWRQRFGNFVRTGPSKRQLAPKSDGMSFKARTRTSCRRRLARDINQWDKPCRALCALQGEY